MYVFSADTWCDSCGEKIRADLTTQGLAPEMPDDEYSYDSDEYPKWAPDDEETDYPDHCAAAGDCLEGIDLGAYGLAPDAELVGAESRTIGALLSDVLTDAGVSYLCEMLDEVPRTPYQEALHRYWREQFGDAIYSAAIAAAEKDGRETGKAAGTWAFDGNSTVDEAAWFLRGIDDGDPEVLDGIPPSPLAGQWGDDPTPREILARFGFGFLYDEDAPETADEALTVWADAWTNGYIEQAESDARTLVGPTEKEER